jgi:hypothetical protein
MLPLLLLACGNEPPQEVPSGPALVSIEVLPGDLTLDTSPAGSDPVQFQAVATYDDGQEVALDAVEWTVSNRSAGEIDDSGLFWPSTTNGGITWVTGRLDEIEGKATVTVVYYEDVFVEEVDPSLFEGDATPVTGNWLYPEDGVNIPRNTPSIHFQWVDAAAEAYKLQFRSELTNLTVYTTQNQWIADNETWVNIAATNAGGQVDVELSGSVAGALFAEPPISVAVNRLDAEGSVIYWSTSVCGFMEIPFGDPAQEFLTGAQAGHCVGCHSISSRGDMAFTYDGGNGPLGIKRIDDQSDIVAYATAPTGGNFQAFSPDGNLLLVTYSGNLYLYEGDTGVYLWPVRENNDVTHIDWSPDGTRIVFTLTTGHSSDWAPGTAASLATMDHMGSGSFENLQVLVAPPEGWLAYYPAFSPDGDWIAFNMSTGDCYDDPDAEMWVIDVDGNNAAIRLDRANLGTPLTNSWPRWGPLPDDDVLWLAVASKRNYGFQTAGNPQIWVAAFDPALANQGMDPSWPAFWLPGQNTATSNHIPVWVR